MGRAFIFPGQGAQVIGMGADLAAEWPAARAVFDEVDEALGEALSALIWEGDIDTLTLTANAQPALMATSMAVMAALNAEGVTCADADFVAGHSLGEYSALCAAGALSLSDAARLLRVRGQAMQDAVPVGEGAMAAILGLDLAAVQQIVADAAGDEICTAANDNDPSQVVISEVMAQELANVDIAAPKVPLVANVSAQPVSDPATIRALLVEQVTGSVRWREGVLQMIEDGVQEFFEIGAGKALGGMVRRVSRDTTTLQVGTVEGVRAAALALKSQE